MAGQKFGVVGLGVMGENLALNIERHGYSVAGFDADARKVDAFSAAGAGKKVLGAKTVGEFITALERPRRILIMVPAGKVVDAVIGDLRPHLAPGDVLIDGGNSFFPDTERRLKEIDPTGVLFVGCGISGGEEGALWGPSIMPGGNPKAWPVVKEVLQAIAARSDDGTPCCEWIGSGGAGHFVKMVHNGIEYGDMQLIAEAYYLMEGGLAMTPSEMSAVFREWDKGDLNSYLINITAEILRRTDPETGKPMVHVILDAAEQKGTGKWTSQVALDLGIPVFTISDAVFARMISALKIERVAASRILAGPAKAIGSERTAFLEMIRRALFCAKICSYAQGFQLLRAANTEYGWKIDLGTVAQLWRAGCVIRAQFLERITDAYRKNQTLANLLLDGYFSEKLSEYQAAWRSVASAAVVHGIAVPAFLSGLSYFDSYRSATLPANLVQAQRDFFGAHTYRRNDKEGVFHTVWEGK
ncbi:MAG TPA: NADP-dependent phosphogluconate dehydrogenase [Bacteroidota bacterium]|nr:NADP-dependent phosphogluconate dehydrogenase [Bacteroidota bacterium]